MDAEMSETLKDLGFTSGEIKVYTSLIHIGQTTVGPIIKKAKVSNSKIYVLLNKLIDKGVVSYVLKGKTKYFQASQPLSLLDYAQRKEKSFKKTQENLKKVVEDIGKIKEESLASEEATIYKGYNGIKTGMLEAINSIQDGGEYCFFSAGYGSDPYLKRFFKGIALQLKKKKASIRGLASSSERVWFEKYYQKFGYQMKYSDIPWPSDITMAGDFLIIFLWKKDEPILYSLRSETLVNSYKDFFNARWKVSKK